MLGKWLFVATTAVVVPANAPAQSAELARQPPAAAIYGAELEGFEYAHAVERFTFDSQRQRLQMAYMDLNPSRPNGRTVVLMHGKNFCAATWEAAIDALTEGGFRVIAPDQIGFCKSSKPTTYQFTFQQLAANTKSLLDSLNVERTTIVGHSMGGMLATRYALMFPASVEHLVLVNPIGLEDWAAKGVPWRSLDEWHAGEQRTTYDSLRRYQQQTYYGGDWKPEYDRWVRMLAGMYAGPGADIVAWNQAQTADMAFNQPVVQDFSRLEVAVTLIIGERDTTALGKDRAPPEVAPRIGNYRELGRAAARAIPNATLVRFEDLGHSPQVEAPERFNAALLNALSVDGISD